MDQIKKNNSHQDSSKEVFEENNTKEEDMKSSSMPENSKDNGNNSRSKVSRKDLNFETIRIDTLYNDQEEEKKWSLATWFSYIVFLPFHTFRITSLGDVFRKTVIMGMSLTFIVITFFLFTFSIFQFFGGSTEVIAGFFNENNIFGAIDSILSTNRYSFLSLFGFLFLILSFFQLHLMENYLDQIFGNIKYKNETIRKFAFYWAILCFLPIPFISSFMYSVGYKFSSQSDQILTIFLPIVCWIVTVITFILFNKILGKGAYSWGAAFWAGFWSGLFFESIKYLFLFLLQSQLDGPFSSSSIITIVLVVTWVMSCAFIYTFGARIGYCYQFKELFKRENKKALLLSFRRATREIALICMIEMTKRFYENNHESDHIYPPHISRIGININDLCNFAMITPERARGVFNHLHHVGLVKVVQDDNQEMAILQFSPDLLTLEEFISRIEERVDLNIPNIPHYYSNEWFWSEYSENIKSCFGSLTIKDLYELEMKERADYQKQKTA